MRSSAGLDAGLASSYTGKSCELRRRKVFSTLVCNASHTICCLRWTLQRLPLRVFGVDAHPAGSPGCNSLELRAREVSLVFAFFADDTISSATESCFSRIQWTSLHPIWATKHKVSNADLRSTKQRKDLLSSRTMARAPKRRGSRLTELL